MKKGALGSAKAPLVLAMMASIMKETVDGLRVIHLRLIIIALRP